MVGRTRSHTQPFSSGNPYQSTTGPPKRGSFLFGALGDARCWLSILALLHHGVGVLVG